jgi:hypothetical protein
LTKHCEVSVELMMTENVKSPMGCTFDQDRALVHACKSGDAGAFEELVKRYDASVFESRSTSPIIGRTRRTQCKRPF